MKKVSKAADEPTCESKKHAVGLPASSRISDHRLSCKQESSAPGQDPDAQRSRFSRVSPQFSQRWLNRPAQWASSCLSQKSQPQRGHRAAPNRSANHRPTATHKSVKGTKKDSSGARSTTIQPLGIRPTIQASSKC